MRSPLPHRTPPHSSGQLIKYILAGWLIDGSGAPLVKNARITLSDERITDIRQYHPENIFPDEETLDLSGHTMLPGLVDSHVHLFMSGTGEAEIRKKQLDADFEAISPVISGHIRNHLSHGILAVRDGGDSRGHALRYKEMMDGKPMPIVLKVSGKAWRNQGRYGKLIGRPPAGNTSLSMAIAKEHEKIDQIKIVNSGLNSLKEFGKETPPQFTLTEMKAAVVQARKKNLKVMVHANGKKPVEIAILAGCDSIEHGFFMGRENLERMAEKKIMWVPTAYTMKAYAQELPSSSRDARIAEKNFEHQIAQISLAKKLGVHIAIGTDAGSLGVHHGSAIIEEINFLISAGFMLEEAIQCASSNGALLLGLKTPNILKKGEAATFLVVKGPPDGLAENLRRCQVYVDAKPFQLDICELE